MKIQSKLYRDIKINKKNNVGELDGKQLRSTTLDMNNRVSVQFTVEDVERELSIMNMIHGPGKQDLERRKELMKKYQIKRDDLDN